jgi:hypothetical protein
MPGHYDKDKKSNSGKSNAQKRCEGYMRKVKGSGKTKKSSKK